MSTKPYWDPDFTPSYTPMEMLDKGVFEGIYVCAIKGIPKTYKEHPNVLKKGVDPDPSINKFGIKSRMSLKEWEDKGWIKTDPCGWFEWYIKYFHGRRLGEEDDWQIGRWKSYVARHNAQVQKGCRKGDDECRPKQRQGLLQWAWDSDTAFTKKQQRKNLQRLSRMSEVSLESSQSLLINW